jgi:N-acetylmuramoyl-L-alanine amidase
MRHPAVPVVILASALVALAIGPATAFAGELRDLRLLQTEAGTRAELSLDADADVRLFALSNPDRLVLDLPDTRLARGMRLPGANGAVSSLRTGEPTPGTLRIVFDLGLPARETHHFEADGNGRRLVVELADPSARRALRPEPEPLRVAPPPVAFDTPATTLHEAATPADAAPSRMPAMPTRTPLDVAVETLPAAPASGPVPTPLVASAQEPLVAEVIPPVQPPRVLTSPRVTNAERAALRAPSKTMQDVIGRGQRKLVVAIDAGHGGKDPGAHGPTGVREKQVTLEVARELARQINADPGMRAVLIRDGDSFVPLKTRYMKARSAQADLFISIHADASPNDTATGASVFVLSTRGASSQAARWLADSENAADLVGGVKLDSKDANLAAVLLDLSQSATMRASDDVAGQVLAALKNVGKAHKPAIERANFVVLRSPDVPSMLVETGFITNPGEERRLNDPAYRARLAAAITDGVRRYFIGQPPPGSWFAASGDDSRPSTVASAPQ